MEWERGMYSHEEIEALTRAGHRTMERAAEVLELANRSYSLYFQRTDADRLKLLDLVLLNCSLAGEVLTPTYMKPFNIIAEMPPGSKDPGAVHLVWSFWMDTYRTSWVDVPGECKLEEVAALLRR